MVAAAAAAADFEQGVEMAPCSVFDPRWPPTLDHVHALPAEPFAQLVLVAMVSFLVQLPWVFVEDAWALAV